MIEISSSSSVSDEENNSEKDEENASNGTIELSDDSETDDETGNKTSNISSPLGKFNFTKKYLIFINNFKNYSFISTLTHTYTLVPKPLLVSLPLDDHLNFLKGKNYKKYIPKKTQFIDARLNENAKIPFSTKTFNQNCFRIGEFKATEIKNKECPYCALYYHATYIKAHSKLCLKNGNLPEDNPTSRKNLYMNAKTRFDALPEIAKKLGVDDTEQFDNPRLFKNKNNNWDTDCNCPSTGNNKKPVVKNEKKYIFTDHARKHRNELPYFCSFCKNNFYSNRKIHEHFYTCNKFKMCLKEVRNAEKHMKQSILMETDN